jgi:hypothetical protein
MKYTAIVLTTVILAGCGQQFRYPCQNPENWDKAECQRPLCEVNRDCPDHIFKENDKIVIPAVPAPRPAAPKPQRTGECE